jgi:hypothetical protein
MTNMYSTVTRGVTRILLLAACLLPTQAVADVSAVVDSIERLPRTQRVAAYEAAMVRPGISEADRVALIRAFSQHAKRLSPHHGPTSYRFDPSRWFAILNYGFKADPTDADILDALGKLLIDHQKYREALPVAAAFEKTHPEHHHAVAWHAWCKAKLEPDGQPAPVLTFPIHFCVLTRNPAAHRAATIEQCRKECEIINSTFRAADGRALARFTFQGFSAYADIADSDSELLRFGDSNVPYESGAVARAFNACTDARVRDRRAINFYIYNSYSPEKGFQDDTSHGTRNSNRPYLLIDWTRLDNRGQNPGAHEMGHAFGLEHVGVPGATMATETNIMTSVGEGFGSGGTRNLGFTEAQAAVILYHAKRTHQRLGLSEPEP